MRITRRQAMQITAVTTIGALGRAGYYARAAGANERLQIASIGVGGQGKGNTKAAATNETLVAMVDVDEIRAAPSFEAYPNVKRLTDYRKLFDTMEKQIDAVIISTPDHTHFHPCYWAFERGKHVYLEKPMAHNVSQVRKLTDLARERRLATQLGCQRHAIPNMARVAELIQANAIGEVTEVHSWISSSRGMPKDPKFLAHRPTLDWDLWVGPAPDHHYSDSFAPYNWRFWWDYGTGETGNWGCHILDIPFRALRLKYPTRVSARDCQPDPMKTPTALASRFEFPHDGRTIALHWYQTTRPSILKEKGIDPKGVNTVFVGTEGILACGFDTRKLYPIDKFKDYKAPAETEPKSPGFHKEWFEACKGGKPATCNFDYSGPLTETVLLANVAYRSGGAEFSWDAAELKANQPAVNALITEPIRKGWEV